MGERGGRERWERGVGERGGREGGGGITKKSNNLSIVEYTPQIDSPGQTRRRGILFRVKPSRKQW